MTRRTETIPAGYFDDLYRANPDPWRFRSSPYEAEKYENTLAALGKPRFSRALEVGCSIGAFTERLAPRCDHLLAIDASEVALATARETCAAQGDVMFEVGMVPAQFPAGRFDLIVLSEVLYYLVVDDLHKLAAQCVEALMPGGELICCHWLNETDYPLTGAQASDLFANAVATRLPVRHILHNQVYRLERIEARSDAPSASSEG